MQIWVESLNKSEHVSGRDCMPLWLVFFSTSFYCFWCLKMCRQRKVNTDIVPVNKRASPCISKVCLCGGVFSSGGSLGIALTLVRVCVRMSKHAAMHAARLCVQSLWVRGIEWRGEEEEEGGAQVRRCGYFATEGTVYRTPILTALSVVFLNVGAQIFFQPSTVSTELTFLTRFTVFKGFFLQRQTHLHQFGGTVQLETGCQQPQKCHCWLRALVRRD